MAEQDTRIAMLNSFLSCPHRDTNLLKELHVDMQKKDPLFYAHLAAWYNKNGDIRDHKEIFIGNLLVDDYLENREPGLALFRRVPVFLKRKILGYIKGKEINLRIKTGKKITLENKKKIDEVKIEKKRVGLFKNAPTSLRKEIKDYLKWLETDNKAFDAIVMRSFNDLKGLYAALKIKPSERAQKILFKEEFPEDSGLDVYKKISEAKNPDEVAKLIVKYKVPYTVAVGLVETITPSILVALINSMSSQELITNYASLEEKGAMNNPDTAKLINAKLDKAATAKNVTALKSKKAQETGRIKNEGAIEKLNKIADTQIKKSGAITADTALFVDKSGSMTNSIEVGKRVSSLISGATEAKLYVVAFDTIAYEINAQGNTMTDWEKAFRPILANGGTSIGSALDYLMRKNVIVEQIVIITDEDELSSPLFSEVYKKYVDKFKTSPAVILITIGAADRKLSKYLSASGIAFDKYSPENNDYYSMPGLITMLARKSKLDLLYEVMDTPLPKRNPLEFAKK